jgi:hypothetical protein
VVKMLMLGLLVRNATLEVNAECSLKHWYLPATASSHGITTQVTNIEIFTTVRTSNL